MSEKQVEVYREEQRILGEQGFQFPQNCWLNIDDIEGEWRAFNKIIKQKESAIQTLVASLQTTQQPYPWQLSSTLDNLLKAIRYGSKLRKVEKIEQKEVERESMLCMVWRQFWLAEWLWGFRTRILPVRGRAGLIKTQVRDMSVLLFLLILQ